MTMHTPAAASGTPRTTRHLGPLLSVAILLSGCDGRGSTPISPGPLAPPATQTYSLSGSVSEMLAAGGEPIEGARITEASSGRTTITDANGRYTIDGLTATSRSVQVAKDGYVGATRTVAMTGDTQLDIRLARLAHNVLSGVVYELTAAGRIPIEGVELYCDSCGSPVGHTFVYSDENGAYRFEWTPDGMHPLFVRKAGYEIFDPAGTLRDAHGRITATVRGDTQFDVQLVRR